VDIYKHNGDDEPEKKNTFFGTLIELQFLDGHKTYLLKILLQRHSLKLNSCTKFKEPVQELFAVHINKYK
jgi:hypothetical protein